MSSVDTRVIEGQHYGVMVYDQAGDLVPVKVVVVQICPGLRYGKSFVIQKTVSSDFSDANTFTSKYLACDYEDFKNESWII